MRNLVVLFSIVLACSSCKLTTRLVTGIRSPRVERRAKVIRYAESKGVWSNPADRWWIVPDSIRKVFEDGFPFVAVFTTEGRLVGIPNCFEVLDDVTDKLISGSYNTLADTGDLANGLARRTSLGAALPAAIRSHKLTVVCYWGRFIGMLNKRRLAKMKHKLTSHFGNKVAFLAVNVDLLKEWNWTQADANRVFQGK